MMLVADRYRTLLVTYLGPQWKSVAGLAVVLLSSIGLQLVNPQILRRFIDSARAAGSVDTLNRTALLFLAVVVLSLLISLAVAYLSERIGWNATNRLREDLTLHCLRLPLAFHTSHTPGELMQRVDGDVEALGNFFSQFIIRILGNGLLLTGILGLLWWEDWRLGMLLGVFAIIAIALLVRLKNIAVPFFVAHSEADAHLTSFWEERLSGAEDLRSNDAIPYTMRRYLDLQEHEMRTLRKGAVMSRVMQSTAELLLALATALAVALGAYLLTNGAITLGTLFLVLAYTSLIAWNLLEITQQLDDLQKAVGAITRIADLYHRPGMPVASTERAVPPGPPMITFDQVSFSYSADTPVLTDISFELAPGAVLGVLGRTGSGKSTLTRLLFRFYDPDRGTIRLNGVDIGDVSLADLRVRIGVVTQDVQLFHATMRDNLTLFDMSISDRRIYEAIHHLGLDSWFSAFPQGLDTELAGDRALSAGEAQLLAFTRVFLREPDLVILDEASSRLDPATEALTTHAVERLLRAGGARRTAIIIAHRLRTIQHVDDIVILDNGRIVEHGARAGLLADSSSRFSRLLHVGFEEAQV